MEYNLLECEKNEKNIMECIIDKFEKLNKSNMSVKEKERWKCLMLFDLIKILDRHQSLLNEMHRLPKFDTSVTKRDFRKSMMQRVLDSDEIEFLLKREKEVVV